MPCPTSTRVTRPSETSSSRTRYTLARPTVRPPSRSSRSMSSAVSAHGWRSRSAMRASRAPPRRNPASASRPAASSAQSCDSCGATPIGSRVPALQRVLRRGGAPRCPANRCAMGTRQLRAALHAFAEDAAWRLAADTAEGAEVPFEVVEQGRRDAPLYCYRPLVGTFVAERAGVLARLPSYLPAVHQLGSAGGLNAYLEARGERGAGTPRERADAALLAFLGAVLGDSATFELRPERLRAELDDLERLVGEGRAE